MKTFEVLGALERIVLTTAVAKIAAATALAVFVGRPILAVDTSPAKWPAAERERAEKQEIAGCGPAPARSVSSKNGVISAIASPIAAQAGVQALRSRTRRVFSRHGLPRSILAIACPTRWYRPSYSLRQNDEDSGVRGELTEGYGGCREIWPQDRRETDSRNAGGPDLRWRRVTVLTARRCLPMEDWRCQSCGKSTLVPGTIIDALCGPRFSFVPADTSAGVKLRVGFRACMSCGHVSASVAPDELRCAIEHHGAELIKQLLISYEIGRYHDVPDLPEARQAADGVAEVDASVLAGRVLEAKRRYRQLAGKTWDEVNATIPHWADLKRRRKLALFGWRREGKLDDEDEFQQSGHPMHDRLLDG
jgi:hypothetical protein